MPSTFFGMELGSRALSASQRALEVVGHNTGNVNTPGYSRQVATFSTTDPYSVPGRYQPGLSQMGTGVTISSINRIRDEFIDRRVQGALSDQGAADSLREVLSRVEQAYNEPGSTGLGQTMTDFFNAFADLSANPESGALRSTVRNRAEQLVSAFRSVSTALSQISPEISAKVAVKVTDVNSIAQQIGSLNGQIRAAVAGNDQPNDLLDKRNELLERLSRLANIQVINTLNSTTGQPTGEIQVNVGGYAIVQNDTAVPLPSEISTLNTVLGLQPKVGDPIPLESGELYGLIQASKLVDGYQKDLDKLASALVTEFNAQHELGYGLDGVNGRDFFGVPADGPTTAANIQLSNGVKSDLNVIAAASPPTPPNPFASGNGDNARALARFTYTKLGGLGDLSANEYYNDRIALIGADSRAFQTASANQEKVLNQLKGQQSSVSGVSLDEELTKMMQYQRTYQAAARIINTMDDVLDRIINGLGRQ